MIYFERYESYQFGDIIQDIYVVLGKAALTASNKEILSLFKSTYDISDDQHIEIMRDKSIEIVVEYQKDKELISA